MPYSSLDNEAAAAFFEIERMRSPYENIGLLYEQDGRIRRTPVASKNRAGRVKGRFEIPAGSLRGIFHNHPNTGGRKLDLDRFSADDLEQAKRLGVPSYIMGGGAFRRFDPRTGETRDVIAEIPIDEIRTYLMRKLLDRAPNDSRGLMR